MQTAAYEVLNRDSQEEESKKAVSNNTTVQCAFSLCLRTF